jgi:hypothetical protein
LAYLEEGVVDADSVDRQSDHARADVIEAQVDGDQAGGAVLMEERHGGVEL